MLVLGLSLHAATDGLAIGAAAATSSISVTATVALAVLIHKGPAAFSLGIFSMHEREQRNDSIRDVVIFSLATPVMMVLAFYALEGLETNLIGLVMLFSAGTFLYVATVDTLPDIHNPETGRQTMLHVLFGAILLIMVLLGADVAGLLEHGHGGNQVEAQAKRLLRSATAVNATRWVNVLRGRLQSCFLGITTGVESRQTASLPKLSDRNLIAFNPESVSQLQDIVWQTANLGWVSSDKA